MSPHFRNEIKREFNSLLVPECLTCRELHALRVAPLVQAVLVVPDLQVYRGLLWVHCVQGHPLFLAAKGSEVCFCGEERKRPIITDDVLS